MHDIYYYDDAVKGAANFEVMTPFGAAVLVDLIFFTSFCVNGRFSESCEIPFARPIVSL